MSNSNFIQIPRSLLTNPLWLESPPKQRLIFLIIVEHCCFKDRIFDNHGDIEHLKRGQLCISFRDLKKLCGKGISKNDIERCLSRFEKYDFLRHKVRQENRAYKSIINVTHKDTYDLICNWSNSMDETRSETRLRQDRDKIETQTDTVVKTTVVVVPDQPGTEKLKMDDVYHWNTKAKKDWSSNEIEEAYKAYLNSKSVIEDPLRYIEGIIKKKRTLTQIKKETKPCHTNNSGKKSSPTKNEFYSENDTHKAPLAIYARQIGLRN